MTRFKLGLWILAIGLGLVALRELALPRDEGPATSLVDIPADGPITVALAGDTLLFQAVADEARLAPVRDLIAGATIAAANLELNLLGADEARAAGALPQPRWPFGRDRQASDLRGLGFDLISLANNHATDYGPEGLVATQRLLAEAGLAFAGTGSDLAAARAPAVVGAGPRRVAFLAFTTSAVDEARASASSSTVLGRPGASVLRYRAEVTVDAATFQTLKESVAPLQAGPAPGNDELTMFGTRILRGERTSVAFSVDDEDRRQLLETIRAARGEAEIVIVSLHSHEPANASAEPAAFVRDFARAAIDAGATLVVGHGPHRLRGVEMYGDGAILYSLGNFLYQIDGVDFAAADRFDSGADLFGVALGTGNGGRARVPPPAEQSDWWEGVVAVATVEGGRVAELRLHPVSLNTEGSPATWGIPGLPASERAAGIVSRLRGLSEVFGVQMREVGGAGLVTLVP
jgi:poly-gamma-glutamate capsule biosynthesis protein CapA/YwtB (metallophosphatase superfamily)